ncbi:MAG: sulfite exporter TauE/SafE family protein [Ardenticatenales bacterium]
MSLSVGILGDAGVRAVAHLVAHAMAHAVAQAAAHAAAHAAAAADVHAGVPLQASAGALAFFTLGLAGGLHCIGMCGPLACLLGRPERTPLSSLGLYHGGRLAAYAMVGVLFASFGAPLRPVLTWPVLAAIAVLPLLLYALRPSDLAPGFLARWHALGARRLRGVAPPVRALGLGLLTPALPCGILYAAAGAAVAAPSAAVGALWMVAFAGGTLPLLVTGQIGFTWAARVRGGAWVPTVRRVAALVAALTLIGFALMGPM